MRQVIGTGRFPGRRIRACRRSRPVGAMCGDLKGRNRSATPVVQSRSSLVQCSNWARSKPVQTSGVRGLGIRCRTTISAGRSSERLIAPAGCDRMTASAGYRHGRRRCCGFSDCSGSCGLRRPQNRSDCWPPSNRNPRWRRTPCSEPATSFRMLSA